MDVPGEHHSMAGRQIAGGAGGGTGGRFNVLAFVQDDRVPVDCGEGLGSQAHLRVVEDQQGGVFGQRTARFEPGCGERGGEAMTNGGVLFVS
jgi:hypothetical protein